MTPSIYEKYYYDPERLIPKSCIDCWRKKNCIFRRAKDEVLEIVYRGNIEYSRCQETPSIVIRAENEIREEDSPRFGRGLHLFEVTRSGEDSGKDYVGLVILRIAGNKDQLEIIAPIAEAYLCPPSAMTRSSYRIDCLSNYSTLLGLLPFKCTPYTMHDPQMGSYCAQGAIYMCLLMLSHHGANVLSPAIITALASPPSLPDKLSEEALYEYVKQVRDKLEYKEFIIRGLFVEEIVDVLRKEETGIYCLHEIFPLNNEISMIAKTFIAYLEAGFPIILPIRQQQKNKEGPIEMDLDRIQRKGLDHVIVLVGYKDTGMRDNPINLVYHDGIERPYMEQDLVSMLEKSKTELKSGESIVGFIVPVPKGVALTYTIVNRSVKRLMGYPMSNLRNLVDVSKEYIQETHLLPKGKLASYLFNQKISLEAKRNFDNHVELLDLPDYVWFQLFFNSEEERIHGYPFLCVFYDSRISISAVEIEKPICGYMYFDSSNDELNIWKGFGLDGHKVGSIKIKREGFRI
jgi:hypothetical protein